MSAEIDTSRFARILKRQMSAKNISQSQLGELLSQEVKNAPSQSAISNWTRGQRLPQARILPAVMNVLGLSWQEVTGSAKQFANADDVVVAPLHGVSEGGPGHQNTSAHNPDEPQYVAFDRREAQRLSNIDPSRLHSTTLIGDSMRPEIEPNSRVFYLPCHQVTGDGLYVFEVDGQRRVKLLQRLGGNALRAIALNETYPNEMFKPLPQSNTGNHFHSVESDRDCVIKIIGKVMFYFKAA
jgi:transcriptional regulator with XRE-family HTH domain